MTNYKILLSVFLFAVLMIGIMAVASRYAQEINAARETINHLGSQVADTACGPVEYARVGEGYPVLVVHGAMGGFDAGLMFARPLTDAGYQVISISRFGYLRSPLPAGANLNRQADAFACLLDTLGIQQAAVLGVSAGATSSIRFAARYPQRISALILLSPAAPGKVKVGSPPRVLFDYFLRNDFVYWAFITYFRPAMQRVVGVPKGFVLTPELEAEVNANLLATLPAGQRMDGFIFDNFTNTSGFYEEISETSPYPLDKIKTPVLLINALDDPLAVSENVSGLAHLFPHARLFIVSDGGHMLLGHANEVNPQITRFLRSLIPSLASNPYN
jgi:pimeloyl-ACP methyl ester carboxylesterase